MPGPAQRVPSRPPAASVAPAPYADRLAVVVNGNAKRVSQELVDVLDQIVATGDLFVSRSLEEGREIARTIVERGYPTVLTGGGDGTFTQTVTWIMQAAAERGADAPRFGLLRLGTGNALAWVVGAEDDRGRGVVPDLAKLRDAGSRELALLDVEGTLTMFAGLGIDAIAIGHFQAVKEQIRRVPLARDYATGGLAYLISVLGRTMPEYVVRPHHHVRVFNDADLAALRLDARGQIAAELGRGALLYEGPSRMVCMSTIPYWGFGARMFPFSGDHAGRFSLRVADIENIDVILNIREIWRGTYRSPAVHDFSAARVRIEYDEPIPLQIGGETVGSRQVVDVALAPKVIRVVDHYAPPRV